jgi:hypothetical protein
MRPSNAHPFDKRWQKKNTDLGRESLFKQRPASGIYGYLEMMFKKVLDNILGYVILLLRQ